MTSCELTVCLKHRIIEHDSALKGEVRQDVEYDGRID